MLQTYNSWSIALKATIIHAADRKSHMWDTIKITLKLFVNK